VVIDPSQIPSLGDVTREWVRRKGLHEFLRRFWCIADPKCPGFIDNWHFGAMAEILTAVSKREIRYVVINQPPGTGKSLTVDVLWPAWHWGAFGEPQHAWMSLSFDHSLVLRNAGQLLDVLGSPLFRAAWPEFKLGGRKSAVGEFFNGHGGYRFSTSFDGKGTGRHVHTQTCDDPVKPKDWNNPKAIEDTLTKWNGTFSTRAIDRRTFARVVIMQRIAERDIAGAMLEEQGYEHLCLPMRYEPGAYWDRGNSIGVKDQRTTKGELLFPERFPSDEVDKAEAALGLPAVVSAQYQQNPTPEIGGVVEDAWLRNVCDVVPLDILRIQSWDFGFKGKKPREDQLAQEMIQSGRSRVHGWLAALILSGPRAGKVIMLDEMDPEPMSYPEAKRAFFQQQIKPEWDKAGVILIEDKANGTGLIDDIQDAIDQDRAKGIETDPALVRIAQMIERVNPTDDKLTRLIRHTHFLQTGGLLTPTEEQCPTIEHWRAEIKGFPRMKWNDRVDTLTQGLDFLRSSESRYHDALGKLF
jgi:phage terminase large subunit-like protein